MLNVFIVVTEARSLAHGYEAACAAMPEVLSLKSIASPAASSCNICKSLHATHLFSDKTSTANAYAAFVNGKSLLATSLTNYISIAAWSCSFCRCRSLHAQKFV